MEAELPCVDFVYQRLVQLTARAFYSLELKSLFKEDEPPDTVPAPKGRASKKQPVECKASLAVSLWTFYGIRAPNTVMLLASKFHLRCIIS